MPRPLRLDYPGALFHVVARGVARQSIYHDDADRRCFLKILGTACDRYGGSVHAFCLMGNHYHVLVESLHGRLSAFMQHVNGSFGRWFNRRHDRIGHLFQGRFKANLIDSDAYLLEAVRYVELNPCRAKLVDDPASWAWGSHAIRVTGGSVPDWLDVGTVLHRFGSDPIVAVARYQSFVLRGLDDDRDAVDLRTESIIGSPAFVARHAARAREQRSAQRVPKGQCRADRPSLDALFGIELGRRERRCRAVEAVARHGYTMTEVAARLNCHYTTISRWVSRAECDNS